MSHQSPDVTLPKNIIATLDIALADERLALATYQYIIERFGPVRPFLNIAKAEQRHINALLNIYEAYGIALPDDETTIDPAIETADLRSLCKKGVEGEAENIRLYDEQLLPAVSAYPHIEGVLRNLRDASALRHKPAFERCVRRLTQNQ
tara:strand:- start:668 stop:1114 length:447 start_codon:yes stop_codon:yes gene_type:complete